MIPDFSKTAKDILKVGVANVGSNEHSDMYSLMKPLDEKEQAYIQKGVEKIYEEFVGNVAEGRSLRTSYVDSIAQGRVWTGADALKINLVDEIGTLEDAVNYAVATIDGTTDLTKWNVTAYPKPMTEFESLMAAFGQMKQEEDVLAKTPFKSIVKTFKDWNYQTSERFYARMPYEYSIK